jgi:CRP/FNR family transcriptional regulator
MNERDQQSIAQMAISRRYETGEWILNYGDIWPYFFLVTEGAVTAIKESIEGRSLIIETFRPCDVFWGVAFFIENAPMPVRLMATEDTHLLMWSKDQMQPILERNGRAGWALSVLMTSRMQLASSIVEDLAFQPVAGRLARFLVDRFGDIEGDRVSRELTLDEMAAYIGSTREMVSRILHRFANQGFIEITRTAFTFTDREALNKLANKSGE